jgi:serine/threonine protein kinase
MENTEWICFVMELCSGGELFDRILVSKRLSENDAQTSFRQILSAVQHCHALGFAHRDLKPVSIMSVLLIDVQENVLFDSDLNIKLIDFGLAAFLFRFEDDDAIDPAIFLHTRCGSEFYAAPEIISGDPYDGALADVWSLGVLLYTMVCGSLPFYDENTQVLYDQIFEGRYRVPVWMSQGCHDVIARCLQLDPALRATVDELLEMPWMRAGVPAPAPRASPTPTVSLDDEVVAALASLRDMPTADVAAGVLAQPYTSLHADFVLILRIRDRTGRLPTALAQRLCAGRPRATSDVPLPTDSPRGTPVATPFSREPSGSVGQDSMIASPLSFAPLTRSPLVHNHPDPSQPSPGTLSFRFDDLGPSSTPGSTPLVPAPTSVPPGRRGRAVTEATPLQPGRLRSLANRVVRLFRGSSADIAAGPREVSAAALGVCTTEELDAPSLSDHLKAAFAERATITMRGPYGLRAAYPAGRLRIDLEICRVAGTGRLGVHFRRLRGSAWDYQRECTDVMNRLSLTVAS